MTVAESVAALPTAIARRFIADHPVEAAHHLETMDPSAAAGCIETVSISDLSALWNVLSPGFAGLVFPALTEGKRAELLESLDRGRAAALIASVDEKAREEYLAALAPQTARDLRHLLSYPEDSAGRIMDTRVFALHGDATAGHVLELMRGRAREVVHFIKIVDDENRLVGQVDVRELAFADPNTKLAELSRPVSTAVLPTDPRQSVVEKFEEFDLAEMPVVDIDGRVAGIIRQDRMVDALRAQASVDIQTMVGVSKDERALSSSWFAIRRRMPWLQINLLTAFLAASVVGIFESTIAKVTALAVLLPVVAGQSGNAGAQALAVTMRGLALREIHFGQWLRVVRKELNAGLWNGVGIAVTCAMGVYIWSGSPGLVLVIAVSMVLSMVVAGIAGALVPIVLARLGQDPAVASSIILTTVTDVAGFFSFLGIATLLASML